MGTGREDGGSIFWPFTSAVILICEFFFALFFDLIIRRIVQENRWIDFGLHLLEDSDADDHFWGRLAIEMLTYFVGGLDFASFVVAQSFLQSNKRCLGNGRQNVESVKDDQ